MPSPGLAEPKSGIRSEKAGIEAGGKKVILAESTNFNVRQDHVFAEYEMGLTTMRQPTKAGPWRPS